MPGIRMGAGPPTGQYYVSLMGERGMAPDGWHWGILHGRVPETVKIQGPLVPGQRVRFRRLWKDTRVQWAIFRSQRPMPQHGAPAAGPGLVSFDRFSWHPGARMVVPPVVPNPRMGAVVVVTGPAGRVLAIRRSSTDPRWPLTWNFPGGLMDPGETPDQAAARELAEETGWRLAPSTLAYLGQVGSAHIYGASVPHEYVPSFLDGEHDAYVWVDLEDFPKPRAGGVSALIRRLLRSRGEGYGWASAYPESKLTVSATASRRGMSNRPATSAHRANLSKLSDFLGKLPFSGRVNSGYRAPAVNAAVGGSRSSQHMNGLAVDFSPSGTTNKAVATWLYANKDRFPELDQVIWYTDTSHVHIGICPGGATGCPSRWGGRGEFLMATKEGGAYVPWAPDAASAALMTAKFVVHRPLTVWAVSMGVATAVLGVLWVVKRNRKKIREKLEEIQED